MLMFAQVMSLVKTLLRAILFAPCILACVNGAYGALIVDRPTLNGLLGATAVTEDFEKYLVGNTNVSAFIAGGGTRLDQNSIFGGNLSGQGTFVRGPGLIAPGIGFDWGGSNLQWNVSFGNHASRVVLGFNTNSVQIDFDAPTRGFGMDLLAPFATPGSPAGTYGYQLQVFAADNTTLLATINRSVLFSEVQPSFIGFENLDGIGRAVLSTTNIGPPFNRTPIFDNVTFGVSAVPEPGSGLLGVVGFALIWLRRRRQWQGPCSNCR